MNKKRIKSKKKPVKIRQSWSRSPVQKPHSTKKGKKGYSRAAQKNADRREVE